MFIESEVKHYKLFESAGKLATGSITYQQKNWVMNHHDHHHHHQEIWLYFPPIKPAKSSALSIVSPGSDEGEGLMFDCEYSLFINFSKSCWTHVFNEFYVFNETCFTRFTQPIPTKPDIKK